MLNAFNFYCWQLHFENKNNNVSYVTIAIFSTFVKHDSFIAYCNAYFFLLHVYCTAILKEIILFVN